MNNVNLQARKPWGHIDRLSWNLVLIRRRSDLSTTCFFRSAAICEALRAESVGHSCPSDVPQPNYDLERLSA